MRGEMGRRAMGLDEDVVRLAKGKNLATVVTLMPDGQPQALLTWVDTDGEHVLVNTEPVRQRAKNLARDPRITVLIHSADNPWDWAEVRGTVVETVGGQPARDHIDELSRKVRRHRLSAADRAAGPDHPEGRRDEGEHPEDRLPLTNNTSVGVDANWLEESVGTSRRQDASSQAAHPALCLCGWQSR
jgi:PPOX class probable F420-dependent enzyme